jgi:hypothetical protein
MYSGMSAGAGADASKPNNYLLQSPRPDAATIPHLRGLLRQQQLHG